MRIALITVILLTGCANYPAATQPRALQLGAFNPYCLLLCFSTAIATDAEHGTATGGSSSQSGTLSISTPVTP